MINVKTDRNILNAHQIKEIGLKQCRNFVIEEVLAKSYILYIFGILGIEMG